VCGYRTLVSERENVSGLKKFFVPWRRQAAPLTLIVCKTFSALATTTGPRTEKRSTSVVFFAKLYHYLQEKKTYILIFLHIDIALYIPFHCFFLKTPFTPFEL
jgi:hypothetical protein